MSLYASRIAQSITAKHHFAVDISGELYVYLSGYYQPGGEQLTKRQVKELVVGWGKDKDWKSKLAPEVCEYIRVDAPALWPCPPNDILNVENGLLNVITRELGPHSPDHLSSIQIPVKYDPTANGEVWKRFVRETFPADAQEVAWEICAWASTPNTSIQKAVVLTADGGNGKSAFLAGLCAFLGRRNICAISLQKLEQDRFAASRLVGKLANICPDLPCQKLTDSAMFKALTGGDVIQAERKFRDSFEFKPSAKLIFSSNHLPQSDDTTHAFFRRWVIVPFTNTFQPGDPAALPRDVLDARLAAPEALSGLLNLALEALPRLRSQGFTISPSMAAALDEYRQVSDPFLMWQDTNVVDDPTGTIFKRELIDRYNSACVSAKRPLMTPTAIGRALRRARPSVTDCQITVNGKTQEAYRGIAWNYSI